MITEIEKKYNTAICDFIREGLQSPEPIGLTVFYCVLKTRIGFIELNFN